LFLLVFYFDSYYSVNILTDDLRYEDYQKKLSYKILDKSQMTN